MHEQPGEGDIQLIRRAAVQGARSQTVSKQAVADAIASTIEAWEDKLVSGRAVRNWRGWAFQVAANAAKRIAARYSRETKILNAGGSSSTLAAHDTQGMPPIQRRTLRHSIKRHRSQLIGRQLEVLLKLAEPQMSLHRAARELRMDRTALRRSFQTGMARLGESR